MDENEEILDLVDIEDHVTGTVKRADMVKVGYRSERGFVRFVIGFLVNAKGEIWVPIRSMHKSIAPGGFDFSVAEHVLSGESYSDAIKRAFAEEAGLTVKVENLVLLGKISPVDNKPTWEEIYLYPDYSGNNPDYDKEEFSSAQWQTIEEIEEKIRTGALTKSAYTPALKLLKDHLSRLT